MACVAGGFKGLEFVAQATKTARKNTRGQRKIRRVFPRCLRCRRHKLQPLKTAGYTQAKNERHDYLNVILFSRFDDDRLHSVINMYMVCYNKRKVC